jgi:hypothetical protein
MAADEADVVEKVAKRFGDHELDSVLVLVQEDSVHHHVTVGRSDWLSFAFSSERAW